MNFFERLLIILDAEMPIPTLFGWFHILCLILTALVTFFLIKKYKDSSDKVFRKIILISWLIIVIFEGYKQLNFSFNVDDLTWNYNWYYFPYQFCSTPLYVLPFIIFCKEGKFRDAFLAYTITYAFFGGLAVMIYPGDVYIETIGINIQTMVHHGSQVVLGIFVAVHERKKFGKKFFALAIPVFVVAVLIALAFNVIGHFVIPDEGLNMFYVGPYKNCTLPLLNVIYPLVPWPVFFILYVGGFTLILVLIALVAMLIKNKFPFKNHAKEDS